MEVRSEAGTFLRGLDREDFSVSIGGKSATVTTVLETGETYIVNIQPPTQPAEGSYDLGVEVAVHQKAASATQSGAISYTASLARSNVNVVLVLDRSGSMEGSPLENAKEAARLFVDLMNPGDQIGVVSFSDDSRVDFPLTPLVPAQAPLFADAMEGEAAFWSADAPWGLATSSYHSFTHSWTDSPGGNYDNNANTTLWSPFLNLSGLHSANLSFWHRYDLENDYDFGRVWVTTDNGVTFTQVASFTGTNPSWSQATISLDAFAGQPSVRIVFQLLSDGSVTRDGWTIDDIAVEESDVRDAAKAAIDGIVAEGWTSIGAGLRDAVGELNSSGDAPRPWVTVLLSDGYENRAPYVNQVLPDVLQADIKAFTIGLGSAVDEALLREIASRSGSQYVLAPTDRELRDIYAGVSARVAGRQSLITESGRVGQGQIQDRFVSIDSSVSEVIFSLTWTGAGNAISFTLWTPFGRRIDPQAAQVDPAIDYVRGSTYAYYRVQEPEVGRWTLRIEGQSVSLSAKKSLERLFAKGGGQKVLEDLPPSVSARLAKEALQTQQAPEEEFTLSVQAVTGLTMEAAPGQEEYFTGDAIVLRVGLSDFAPILGAAVQAEARVGGDARGVFALYDDGRHGDGPAGDGVYGNSYTRTAQAGAYELIVDAAGASSLGEAFTRRAAVSVLVVDAADQDGDGMPDDWELNVGLDPSRDDADGDPDGDGLVNLAEFQEGTDPLSADTDEDFLPDGEEVNVHFTDPTNPDTDGGGEMDGSEVLWARDPLDFSDDNRAPYVPSDPSLADGAADPPRSPILTWQGGDPNPTDVVRYDVYFGTQADPPLVAQDLAQGSYDPGPLDYSALYFWRVVARDGVGLETAGPLWSFGVRSEVWGAVNINQGDLYARKGKVTLNLIYERPTHMRFSNDGVKWSKWFMAAPTRRWKLAKGDGPKTVYAQFAQFAPKARTPALTSPVTSDAIVLDAGRPSGSILINEGDKAVTEGLLVVLTLQASDATSGVDQMMISNSPNFQGASWEDFVELRVWALKPGQGKRGVYVRYRDRAGNVSKTYRDRIKVVP